MAANRIKGITIEIGGDTTKLSNAIKGVNSQINSTKTQLKDVEKLLKLDPTNTELLRQKQELLSEAVAETSEKLRQLQEADKQAKEQLGDKVSTEEYNALQREIIATSKELKSLEDAASQSNAVLNKIGATAKSVGDAADSVAEKTKVLSGVATAALTSLGAMAYSAITASDDLNTLAKQTGFSTAELQKMQYAADLIDVSADTITGAAAKMTKGLSTVKQTVQDTSDVQEKSAESSNELTDAYNRLGVSVRDTGGNFKSTNELFYEVISALAEIENETERDTLAMTIFGKSANELAGVVDDGGAALKELGDQAESLGLILDQKTLDQLNEANDKIDTMKANIKGVIALNGAKLLDAVSPMLDDLVDIIGKATDKLASLDEEQLETVIAVTAVIAAISPAAKIVSGITGTVEGLSGALTFLLAHPVVAAIAAVVAAITLIVTKGKELKEGLDDIDESLQGIFDIDFEEKLGEKGKVVNKFFDILETKWDNLKKTADGFIDFFYNVFRGNWEEAWNGILEIADGTFGSIIRKGETFVNFFIDIINTVTGWINHLIQSINNIAIDVPDWVPGIGGKHFGFNIGEIGQIDKLDEFHFGQNSENAISAGREVSSTSINNRQAVYLSVENNISGYTEERGQEITNDMINKVNEALGRQLV